MDYDDDEKDHRGCLRLCVDEVFYLSREDGNDIFITRSQTRKLERHQHRGLRFLYRQFKMKKPGVIMNDASGSGKKVQTAVFLDAIKNTLTVPALVLCNEIERDNWKYYFMHFGRDYKEILSFDATLPTTDKKIFIRSFDDLETVIKKTWSIVVIDDPVAIKMFKPLKNLKADFRIWVVSIDLKHNLNTFAAINDWVNPGNTFSIQDFTPKNKTVDEIIGKAVLLDRYFEELVLSRGHDQKDDKQKQTNKIKTSTTKKNKDPTGTKTKKSTIATVNKPNTSTAGTSKAKTTIKRSWKGNKNDESDDSWEEPGAAKRNKQSKSTLHSKAANNTTKANKAIISKAVTAKPGTSNKATSNPKLGKAKGVKNKLGVGFDYNDDDDDDSNDDICDFDDDESDLNSFPSDEDEGETRFMAKQYLKAESHTIRKNIARLDKKDKVAANKCFSLTKKTVGLAKEGVGSIKKDLSSSNKDIGLLEDLQNQSNDLTTNNEDQKDTSTINDSIDFELNTIPIEADDNVGNKSNDDRNIETSNISKNNSDKEPQSGDSKDERENQTYYNKMTEKSLNQKEFYKNLENNDITAKTAVTQLNTSHSKLEESIIDTKIRDLEEKTSAQFKGSILDQLLDSNKTSPRSISSRNSDKIVDKSEESNKHDIVIKSPKASTSKVVNTAKAASPVIIASQSPTIGSPQKIDDQIKELERTTYDRFKGSVLDKLF